MFLEVAFSPNGNFLLVNFLPMDLGQSKINAPVLRVWDMTSGKQVLERKSLFFTAFSPDSRLLAGLAPDGTLALLDIASDSEVLALPFSRPWTLDFTPDGVENNAQKKLVFALDGSCLAMMIIPAPQEGATAIQFLDLTVLRRGLAEMGVDW
jgi:WD40 repeat protein